MIYRAESVTKFYDVERKTASCRKQSLHFAFPFMLFLHFFNPSGNGILSHSVIETDIPHAQESKLTFHPNPWKK